jgi:transcriptional regulator with XRE-family HTH domain
LNIITNTVRFEMKNQGLSIKELAAKADITPTYLTKLLNNDRRWNIETIFKVLDALNLEIEIKPAPKGRRRAVI